MAPIENSTVQIINYTEHELRIEHRFGGTLETINLAPFGMLSWSGQFPDLDNSRIPVKLTIVWGPNQGASYQYEVRQKDAYAGGDGIFAEVRDGHASGNPDFMIYQVAHGKMNKFQIVPNYDLASWMSHVPLTKRIIDMLLPATHDSACIVDLGGTAMSWTQAKERSRIPDQLNYGIRAFDLRFELRDSVLVSVHGPENMNYAPSLIMKEIFEWLPNHSTEFVLAKIRGNADVTSKLWEIINSNSSWKGLVYGIVPGQNYVQDVWPTTLNDCKGRLLIQTEGAMRGNFGGIQCPPWPDNTADGSTISANMKIRVQDEYNQHGGTFEGKWGKVLDMLRHQQSSEKSMWYYNFLNASGRGFPNVWSNGSPGNWGMNRHLMWELAGELFQTSGVIWLDYFREPMDLNALPRLIAALNSDGLNGRFWTKEITPFPQFPGFKIPRCPMT
ncbi:hypothetical protein TWF718_005115 [Orbilia javanica]|uniref:Phosphatidylinositol-specific phospholipase C X domain-containing protein n=1 Tax=Orbilia javanica TaxID=47235 RepID=A0AAN8N3Q8_9PEZI